VVQYRPQANLGIAVLPYQTHKSNKELFPSITIL